jgi:thiol-disulfide isomerase/thioredoxin
MKKIISFLILCVSISCSKDYTVLESIDGLILSSDQNTKIINQSTTLKLVKNNGEDVTAQAEFFVNGGKITTNVFSKQDVGSYIITSKYKGIESSNTLEIIYHDGSLISFKSNVLVEDYTGVWCGNCPRVVHALELADQQLGINKNQLVKVAIHRSSSNPQDSSYDPYNFDSSQFEPNGGYPKAFINRKTRWTPLEYNNLGMVISQTQILKRLGLKLKSELVSNNSIKLTVDGLFAENLQNIKLVVYVLESGYVYNQINYTAFYNGADPIINFVHDHVLKDILTQHNGDVIANTSTGSDFSREFTINTSSFQDINKVEFVAFFVNNDGTVLNARLSKYNEIQDYEIQ